MCAISLNWSNAIGWQGKKIHGGSGELAPEMPKRAPESHKRAQKNCIEFNAKQNKKCYFHASKLEK